MYDWNVVGYSKSSDVVIHFYSKQLFDCLKDPILLVSHDQHKQVLQQFGISWLWQSLCQSLCPFAKVGRELAEITESLKYFVSVLVSTAELKVDFSLQFLKHSQRNRFI